MRLTYLLNVADTKYGGYREGDEVVVAGEIPDIDTTVNDDERLADVAFLYFNRDDRPNGQTAPSMSIGDVVLIERPLADGGSTAWAVEPSGFRQIPFPYITPLADGERPIDRLIGARS